MPGPADDGRLWDISDGGAAAVKMTRAQVVDALLSRSLGVGAMAFVPATNQWTPLEAFPEFALACPSTAFARSGQLPRGVNGYVGMSPSQRLLLETAARTRADPAFPRIGFFLPLWLRQPGLSSLSKATMFQFWDRWYVTCMIPSGLVKPGVPLRIVLVAVNLSRQAERRTLVPTGVKVPPEVQPAFEFELGPNHWDAHEAWLPPPEPGQHSIGLRSTSEGKKWATTALVAAASLGTFVYRPGHQGFSTTFTVLHPDSAARLRPVEDRAVHAFQGAFEENRADRLVAPTGESFPSEQVLQWYRVFLEAHPSMTLQVDQALSAGKSTDVGPILAGIQKTFVAREYPAGTSFPAAP